MRPLNDGDKIGLLAMGLIVLAVLVTWLASRA
jgi:hypothetical protein